jgi:SAM-dependent methyltransferase
MNETKRDDAGQSALWNGSAGRAWVDAQPTLDAMFEPFETRLVDVVAARWPRCVLDVGCGTGATTLAIAQSLDPASRCIGVDISAPMIEVARARAEHAHVAARFIQADAQDSAFGALRFDMIVSRFGVMFFEEPVAAFANLHRAATEDACLCFFAWRDAAENSFMTIAERTARRRLDMPTNACDAPGQFAFADRSRIRRILEAGGWNDVAIEAVDIACRFPSSELTRYISQMGPLGRALQHVDEPTRVGVVDEVRAAFEHHVHGDEVRFDAACWMVCARSTGAMQHEGGDE